MIVRANTCDVLFLIMQPLRQLRGPIPESRVSDSLLQVQHFCSVGNVFISVSYLKVM